MGVVACVSGLFSACRRVRRRSVLKQHMQLQTLEIKVKMDCEGCERKVKKAMQGMKGVNRVEIDPRQHKLTVTGNVDPNKVIKRLRWKTGKKAEPWPYVPYNTVAHPYAPGAYDKRAPKGYVRNVMSDPNASRLARASSTEERYANAFSDDNANACTIM